MSNKVTVIVGDNPEKNKERALSLIEEKKITSYAFVDFPIKYIKSNRYKYEKVKKDTTYFISNNITEIGNSLISILQTPEIDFITIYKKYEPSFKIRRPALIICTTNQAIADELSHIANIIKTN